jgi:diaminopimelate epimerase
MRYFNSDGKESTMCGNGGRCMTAFANSLGIIKGSTKFMASDGLHEASIIDSRTVTLQMKDVDSFKKFGKDYFLDTGSPHYVKFIEDISKAPVYTEGKQVRYDKNFSPGGTNVNFVQVDKDLNLSVRTYERGVENETLACGTGIVASALSTFLSHRTDKTSFLINAVGGKLKVHFDPYDENKFRNIWLTGPVEFVFAGEIEL